ncbi:MAG: type II toxin-antitoxin system VapC family toxin [Gemmatimonadaceae bacterium]
MILVDTSVWIEHLKRGDAKLAALLSAGLVLCHPFVIGELACGSLRRRGDVLSLLARLPHVTAATHDEALSFLEARRLVGLGLGWIDIHLLASSILDNVPLWTLDRPLARAAIAVGVATS